MIDIHAHIIPNVDDGSTSLEQSLELVRHCVEMGVTDIVCTPHYEVIPIRVNNNVNVVSSFEKLKEEIEKKGYPVKLYFGNEITNDESVLELVKNKKALPINDSKYILLELDFYSLDLEIGELIYEFSLLGYQVIIAHVERYMYTNYEYVDMLVNEGALIQVNSSSFFSKSSTLKKLMLRLVKEDLVHFVASDVHFDRENKMKDAYKLISKKFGKSVAERLFVENPRRVLMNKEI